MENAKAFSKKWRQLKHGSKDFERFMNVYKKRTLELYGLNDEKELKARLSRVGKLLDAGCGNGGKTNWYANLNPKMSTFGVDFSDSITEAKACFTAKNLFFIKQDILKITDGPHFDLIICDQVLHHIKEPEIALKIFKNMLTPKGELWTYVYRKKALPRELLDEHFRHSKFSHEDLMDMSEKLTDLGKLLQDRFPQKINLPDIRQLGIRGGKMTLQEYVYYNFLKCYWNDDVGRLTSVLTNYDWYAPKIAYRYTVDEFVKMMNKCGYRTNFLHLDKACISGRFVRR